MAIALQWVYATARIENEWGDRGSGFLVAREVGEQKVRVFLVTNKHVIHEDADKRKRATRVVLSMNVKGKDGQPIAKSGECPLS